MRQIMREWFFVVAAEHRAECFEFRMLLLCVHFHRFRNGRIAVVGELKEHGGELGVAGELLVYSRSQVDAEGSHHSHGTEPERTLEKSSPRHPSLFLG